MNLRDEFSKIKWERASTTFVPKRIDIIQSANHNASGNLYGDAGYFDKQTAKDNMDHLYKMFQEYARQNPYVKSAMVKRLEMNPATKGQAAILNELQLSKWREKGQNWSIRNEPKEFNQMLYSNMHGIKADKKPRGGAVLSSSWVRGGSGKNMPNAHTLNLNLGGQNYQYGVDWNKFKHCRSIGSAVARLRVSPPGTEIDGLKKLW